MSRERPPLIIGGSHYLISAQNTSAHTTNCFSYHKRGCESSSRVQNRRLTPVMCGAPPLGKGYDTSGPIGHHTRNVQNMKTDICGIKEPPSWEGGSLPGLTGWSTPPRKRGSAGHGLLDQLGRLCHVAFLIHGPGMERGAIYHLFA